MKSAKSEDKDELYAAAQALDLARAKKTSKKGKGGKLAIITVLLLLGSALLIFLIGIILSLSNNTSLDVPYSSATDGFSVNFPEDPEVESLTEDVSGISVPYTQYATETDNGNKAYIVQVVHYPTADFDLVGKERTGLDGAMKAMEEGATVLSSSNDATFLGYPAANNNFTQVKEGVSYNFYTLNFVKGNSLYTIMTGNEDEAGFNAFVNTFRLN
jgi:hypothetical protein